MATYGDLATDEVIAWLLEGDSSVRWQVRAHLLDESPSAVEAERAKVATEGWGARYLALQDPEGTWSRSLYAPKWTSTHYTLLTLWRLGLPRDEPRALRPARTLLDSGWKSDHGMNFTRGPGGSSETCISGMSLALLSYFDIDDERVHLLADHMLGEQMSDCGWNCRSHRGATHASFHTTSSALEGLTEYARAHPGSGRPVEDAMARGREFLLEHKLYRSHRTGEVVSEAMTRFAFPPYWQHDVMRALDHFVAVNAPRDERARDAVELVLGKRDEQGRWPQYRGPSGKYFFPIESVGKPSRMNTLRALRLARWWFGAS